MSNKIPNITANKNLNITLRIAKLEDLSFLYKVSILAMKYVSKILDIDRKIDETRRFEEYKNSFLPSEINIIVCNYTDVGRLRIVRSEKEIYVGGIQILPKFQNLGIGTKIFAELTKEAQKNGKIIRLEVHKVNTKAINFYKKLGFEIFSTTEKKFTMTKNH